MGASADHRHAIAPPLVIDVAIAALTLALSLALLSHGGFPPSQDGSQVDAASGALAAVATLPLVVWRRAPFAVLVVTAAASALSAALGYALGAPFGPAVALYLLAASRTDDAPWTRRTGGAAVAIFAAYLAATIIGHDALSAGDVTHVGLAWAVAWFAGERTRLRREHIADLEQRALRSDRDAQRDRELATAQERARIARDLHDSAGHAISVIAVRAGAARLRHDEDPERSRAALQDIEQLARQTAAEIDAIVGALRNGEPTSTEPPGIASIDSLVKRRTEAGLNVSLATSGAPRPLDTPVDQAAYRILQEALTNAARHGTGSAQVELAYTDTGLQITVDNPVLHATSSARPGQRHGLVGMRERAALLDGALDARRINGGFRLRADLPYRSPDA